MIDRLHMDRETLASLLEVTDITSIPFEEIVDLFRQEKLPLKLPEGTFAIDPRNGDRILYHASRSFRPHDTPPSSYRTDKENKDCVICRGETTGVIDVADLSEGFTFINKNLFPVLYPESQQPRVEESAYGMHFLQWTSSYHDKDWHNMPVGDCKIVVSRLAALENKLLEESPYGAVDSKGWDDPGENGGHVIIIKNYGRAVGASLRHGHQQVLYTNIAPRRTLEHVEFLKKKHEPLTAEVIRENPAELMITDYEDAVLLVPAFMRRPYEMFLIVKNWRKSFLHELTEDEIGAVGKGWHDATRAIHHIMPRIGKEVAYNVASFTGPGAGIYFEFLPYTQFRGGLEQIGLYVCQETPTQAARRIRELLADISE